MLGAALAYAWVAYPYTAFALETNTNDTLVAATVVFALLGLTVARPRLSGLARGAAVGLGAAAKFAPPALAPLFARGRGGRAGVVTFVLAVLGLLVVTVLPFVPDGGLREMFDRTVGYQAARPSPFSLWGQEPGIEWLQTSVKVAAA